MKKFMYLLALVLVCTLAFCSCGKDKTPYDFDLKEYITLGQYPDVKFDEEDFNTHMNEAIEEITSKESVATDVTDRPVKKGDKVNIDYVGTKDGKEFEGGSAKGTELEIGSGSFIAGFEDGLIGKNIGDEVKLDLVFPEDYKSEDLAGEEVVFTVKINGIKEETHPALTDDLVKEHTEYTTLQEFYDAKTEEIAKDVLWETYLASCKVVKYPKNEVKVYYDNLVNSYSQMSVYNGMTLEQMVTSYYGYATLDDFLSYVMNTAMASVKEEMVIYLTARENNFEVSDDEYKTVGEKQATEYGYASLKEYEEYMGKDGIILEIYREKLIEKAYEGQDIKYDAPPVEDETAAGSAEEETKPEETKTEETKAELADSSTAEETKAEPAESSAESKAEETKATETEAAETKAEPEQTNA